VAGRAFFPIVDNRGLMFGYTKKSVRKELHGRPGGRVFLEYFRGGLASAKAVLEGLKTPPARITGAVDFFYRGMQAERANAEFQEHANFS